MSEADVYRRQILTSKIDPRAVRVKNDTCLLKFCFVYNASSIDYFLI